MNGQDNSNVTLSPAELELMLGRAAEAGARKALHDLGLHDEDAAEDMRQLRGLLDAWRDAKSTAWKTFVGWSTKGLLLMLVLGVWFKANGLSTK